MYVNRPAEYSKTRISLISAMYEMYGVILKGRKDVQVHERQCK